MAKTPNAKHQNRAERRAHASKNKPSGKTAAFAAEFAAFQAVLEGATERTTLLLEGIRYAAAHDTDVVYKKPLLLMSTEITCFGEAENVAAAFAAVTTDIDAPVSCSDLSEKLGGMTMSAIADLFFREEEEMTDALIAANMAFVMLDFGIADDAVLKKAAEHLGTVYKLLGYTKKSSA